MPLQPWNVTARRSIVDDRWLQLDACTVTQPDGTVLDPYYLINESNWACAIPVRPDGKIILVEQYRLGVDRVTLELPAGDIDANESAATAAVRECREETGYEPNGEVVPLGCLHVEPARNASSGCGFFVPVAAEARGQSLDAAEGSIAVRVLSTREVQRALQAGRISHACHAAFLYRAFAEGLLTLT